MLWDPSPDLRALHGLPGGQRGHRIATPRISTGSAWRSRTPCLGEVGRLQESGSVLNNLTQRGWVWSLRQRLCTCQHQGSTQEVDKGDRELWRSYVGYRYLGLWPLLHLIFGRFLLLLTPLTLKHTHINSLLHAFAQVCSQPGMPLFTRQITTIL